MFSLRFKGESGHGREMRLDATLIRIGRAVSNDIVIDNIRVSRFHAEITRRGRFLNLRDLGSTNGTFVNGRPIATCPVIDGDQIRLGSEELELRDDGEDIEQDDASVDEPALPRRADISETQGTTRGRLERTAPTTPVRAGQQPTADVKARARGTSWIGDAVAFNFAAQGRPVQALITYEALVDHFGARGLEGDDHTRAIEAYVENAIAINVAASLRYAQDPREPVLLRTSHF